MPTGEALEMFLSIRKCFDEFTPPVGVENMSENDAFKKRSALSLHKTRESFLPGINFLSLIIQRNSPEGCQMF
jgi:hypothetical protein